MPSPATGGNTTQPNNQTPEELGPALPVRWQIALAVFGSLLVGYGIREGLRSVGYDPGLQMAMVALTLGSITIVVVLGLLGRSPMRKYLRLSQSAMATVVALSFVGLVVLILGKPAMERFDAQRAADPDFAQHLDLREQTWWWATFLGGNPAEVAARKAAQDEFDTELQDTTTTRGQAYAAKVKTDGDVALGLKDEDRFTNWDQFECEWRLGWMHKIGVICKIGLKVVLWILVLWFVWVAASTWNKENVSAFHKFWVGGGKWGIAGAIGFAGGVYITDDSITRTQCRALMAQHDTSSSDADDDNTPAAAPGHQSSRPQTVAVKYACPAYCEDNPTAARQMWGVTCGNPAVCP